MTDSGEGEDEVGETASALSVSAVSAAGVSVTSCAGGEYDAVTSGWSDGGDVVDDVADDCAEDGCGADEGASDDGSA
ncbi:MAG: hypothetical protein Q4G51_03600 [Dermatophilus congolensis]|nr:hypothetical protein [Dermatophilus congolensis]